MSKDNKVMNAFRRFTTLATLAAFLGLTAVETFHTHDARQTEANCAICQVAHRTPAIISQVPSLSFQGFTFGLPFLPVLQSYVQFVFVSHGLSPPVL